MLRENPENFFSRIITWDETWFHHLYPETKQKSKQLKHKESPILKKKIVLQQSAGKIMATVFWGSEGFLLLKFMPQKTTTTGDTYASTIVALRENIKQKHRGNLSAGVLLLHDNAPAHKSHTSRAAIRKCGFIQLNHPPYSPDLASSDYFLFRNLKHFCVGDYFPMTMQSRKL